MGVYNGRLLTTRMKSVVKRRVKSSVFAENGKEKSKAISLCNVKHAISCGLLVNTIHLYVYSHARYIETAVAG